VPPAEPPPHEMLPGLALNALTRSAMVLYGEFDGTTMISYSPVKRANGVTMLKLTGEPSR